MPAHLVQWIERKPPKLQMRFRLPQGTPIYNKVELEELAFFVVWKLAKDIYVLS